MAKRIVNILGETATEYTLRAVLRAVSFARDTNDRLRVVVDNQVSASIFQGNQNNNIGQNNIAPYNAGSWNVVDARDTARDIAVQNFQAQRSRWTIT